ncbi:hypothetical protein K2Z83_20670 [Oscillochloris sp. ZM17-4]|uniref:hypothetical protein n=1 Tax=Oscillochloris sp. ZM17-4 TaxID=2866714 RepID=UPI001C73C16C|nr:hypothetical protein [Oscillochloris sp. ZM17-4]MBX0330085.1 hypothetical protein [Oscillochloris sp. ZM17-4]
MRRLMIIACGATKRHDAGLLPAIDRYDGPPYRTLRANLRELAEDRRPTIRILSAEFGLIPAETPIPDYDHRMTQARALALQGQVRAALADLLVAGDYAAAFVNLGADYMPALPLNPTTIPRLGVITTAHGGIGERMALMKCWLREA